MRPRCTGLLFAIFILLAGLSRTFAQEAVLSTSAAGLPAVEAPTRVLASWREAKGLLVKHQPSLQQQLAAVGRAGAGVKQALSRLLPQLELGVGTDYAFVRPSPENVFEDGEFVGQVYVHETLDSRSLVPRATATFSITFSLANLVSHESASVGLSAERHALRATRHRLIGSLASTLLGVLGAERVAAQNLVGLEAAGERMRLTERLVQLGRATEMDIARFAQDLHEAEANVVSANESLSQAREQLGQALGVAQPVAIADGFEVLALLSPTASGCVPLAELDQRPDLMAARARQRAAKLASNAASLAYLPEIRLGSQYVMSYAPTTAVAFDGEPDVLHTWTASANLVWTAFDGGARAAGVSGATADLRSSGADREANRIQAVTEVRRTNRLVTIARSNADIARRNVAAARKLDALSRKSLEFGTASALEVVDAARRLRVSEITLAVRDVELISARVRAHMAKAVCR